MATNLLEMIMSAQGGAAANQAGQSVGLNQSQTQAAIAALLPAVSSALKKNTQSPQGLGGLLQALQSGNHARYVDQPEAIAQPASIADGNAILGHLFGSKDVSRAVASHASQKTGIGDDILKKMLPMVAAMAMGGLSKQTQQPSIQSQLGQMAIQQMLGGSQKPGGGLGNLIAGVFGNGARRQQRKAHIQHQAGLGILGKMLDADGDGNLMDDVLEMAMNRR